MGLDLVELVMSVEEEFGIDIPDSLAEKISTVGDLADIVASELARSGQRADPDRIFERIRTHTAEWAVVSLEQVTRESRFVQDLGLG